MFKMFKQITNLSELIPEKNYLIKLPSQIRNETIEIIATFDGLSLPTYITSNENRTIMFNKLYKREKNIEEKNVIWEKDMDPFNINERSFNSIQVFDLGDRGKNITEESSPDIGGGRKKSRKNKSKKSKRRINKSKKSKRRRH